jgi:hypothetical protein
MSTLFNRLRAYTINHQKKMLNAEDRALLGRQVQKDFIKAKVGRYWKQPSNEPGFMGQVNCYPKGFTLRIDKLIVNYYRKLDRK